MKTKTIAYYLYFIACVTALFAIIIDSELLLLVSKPMIIPAVYFYYLTKAKKVDFLFTLVILLNFIGDTIILLKIKDPLFVMVPYYLSYLILIWFIVVDILKTKGINMTNILLSLLVLIGHAFMLYLVLDLQTMDGKKFILPFSIYGVTLSLMVTLSVYNYLSDKSISGFYMLIACGCCLVSDVFYVLYNEHFHIPILSYINSAMQFFTYIFLVKYMLYRKNAGKALI